MTDHRRSIIVRMGALLLAATTVSCNASEQQVTEMATQAQQLLDAGQPAKAREVINHAVQERDDLPELFLVQARVALALGRRGDAYRAYSNALALEATNAEALMGVAETGLNTGHLDEANDAADKILLLNPGQTNAMLVKGVVRMARNDLDGAIAFADQVLAARPDDVAGIILKSRALALQGDRSGALALVGRGIARHGQTLELTMALVELQRQGDAEAFLASLRRIKQLAPQSRNYRFDLVDTLYRLGRVDEARAETVALIANARSDLREASLYPRLWYAYDQAALTPDQLSRVAAKASVETRLELARFYVATGRGQVAAALLRPLATGWSTDIQAGYARALAASGNRAAAVAEAAHILQRDPGNGEALLVQADAALARHDPAGAVVGYQQVVRDYPEWEEGYLGLARAYTAAGKPDGVRRALEDGARALPQNLPLARAQVAALLGLGDKARAQQVARRFAFNSPSLIAGWTLYADTCGRTGGGDCRQEAAEGLRRARSQFGLDPAPGTSPPVALIGRLN